MKKTLLLAGVACLFAGVASADYNPYVAVKAAFSKFNVKTKVTVPFGELYNKRLSDNTAGLRIAAGFAQKLGCGSFRTELELGLNDTAEDNDIVLGGLPFRTKQDASTLMMNVYYDFDNKTNWTPYIGAGVGVARVKSKLNVDIMGMAFKVNEYNLAWNIGAGVAYKINNNWSVDAGYRFTNMGNSEKTFFNFAKAKITTHVHELNLGLRYSF